MIYKRKYSYVYFSSIMVIIMWLVKSFEYFFQLDFSHFGIFPREISSLSGIFTAPFIHGNFNHLISNSMPFFLLSSAIFYFYKRMAFTVLLFTWILTGFSVWLGGRYSWHIGASGLIYAFASFLFFSGILSKERKFIAISLLTIFLYGGMIWGIFPSDPNISWESHLYGFAVGFIIAFFLGKDYDKGNQEINFTEPEDFTETDYTSPGDYEIKYWNDKE